MITWNGGWVLVRREHVLTPTQKKVSLFLFFSFSLFFSTFSSVVSLLLSYGTCEQADGSQ